MPVWVYRKGEKPKLVSRGNSPRGSDELISLPFQQRMQKTLYDLECEQGSKFNIPGYSKATLRKAWWDMDVRE